MFHSLSLWVIISTRYGLAGSRTLPYKCCIALDGWHQYSISRAQFYSLMQYRHLKAGVENEGVDREYVRESQQTVPETPSPEMLGASKVDARVRRRDFGASSTHLASSGGTTQ